MQTAHCLSDDGTRIGYRVVGRGPAVALLHGGMQSSQSFSKLAALLSEAFTVSVPDRRGRGLSGPAAPDHGLRAECADLTAVLSASGARRVFALSSGALVALELARTSSLIDKLAVYEPPLKTARSDPTAWSGRFEQELARGDRAGAMASVIKGTGDASPLQHLPVVLLRGLLRLGLRADARRLATEAIAMRDLIPTMRGDISVAREAASTLADLSAIEAEVLLMGGARSHPALRSALVEVGRRLPRAKVIELARTGHLAADNNGRPAEVAAVLRHFFDDQVTSA